MSKQLRIGSVTLPSKYIQQLSWSADGILTFGGEYLREAEKSSPGHDLENLYKADRAYEVSATDQAGKELNAVIVFSAFELTQHQVGKDQTKLKFSGQLKRT